MSGPLSEVLRYAAFPIAATILGGVVAAFRPPGPRLSSIIQHFAAGVVFAAAAGEILPDVLHERAPVAAAVGFALGIGLMLAVKALAERPGASAGAENRLPTSLVVTLAVDIFIDGLLIGLGFAAGAQQGLLLTLALTVELLFLGLSAVTALSAVGVRRGRSVEVVVGLAALVAVGAVVGTTLLGGLSGDLLEAALAFGLAALLYLVTEELLVEAHEVPETPATTAMFFTGFLALTLVEMLAG